MDRKRGATRFADGDGDRSGRPEQRERDRLDEGRHRRAGAHDACVVAGGLRRGHRGLRVALSLELFAGRAPALAGRHAARAHVLEAAHRHAHRHHEWPDGRPQPGRGDEHQQRKEAPRRPRGRRAGGDHARARGGDHAILRTAPILLRQGRIRPGAMSPIPRPGWTGEAHRCTRRTIAPRLYEPPAGAGKRRSTKHAPCEFRCPCADCV